MTAGDTRATLVGSTGQMSSQPDRLRLLAARSSGAMVVMSVFMPVDFEGARRATA
ncbi:hypothetical protein WG922_09385 [Ramlibacter sp. AN1015]|uniref:hypothetical protein n=1 Tax=Ramlibacter sp. AN1015 TaxID=3133428 RepID=UPI0030BD285E